MEYIINRETEKLELSFEKSEYLALSDAEKSEIKSAFLWSRAAGAWVSRAKAPNLWRAKEIAKKLGAVDGGKTGEALTFAEQQERKAERAEARADRYEAYAANAERRAEALQKPINDMHGDIAFFTQPNINSSAGRAFTNRRNKMFAAYDRGTQEFRKSEYFQRCAETARQTASGTKPTDKGFIQRRIEDAQKSYRNLSENRKTYLAKLENIAAGGVETRYNGEIITADEIREWLENTEERMEAEISKEAYYAECLEDLGGLTFSRENVKPGYIVKLGKYRDALWRVTSCGPKNFKCTAVGRNDIFDLPYSYAEISEIVSAEEAKPDAHPFKVGETFSVKLWNGKDYVSTEFEIVKATEKSVTVKNKETGKTIVRKPKLRKGVCYEGGKAWCLFLNDSYQSGYIKQGA